MLHLMADAFKELAQYDILLLSESSEDLNLSFVIDQSKKHKTDEDIDALVESLHCVLLERENGLKTESPCLFGSTLPELLRSEVVASPNSGKAGHSSSSEVVAPYLDLDEAALDMSSLAKDHAPDLPASPATSRWNQESRCGDINHPAQTTCPEHCLVSDDLFDASYSAPYGTCGEQRCCVSALFNRATQATYGPFRTLHSSAERL